MFEEDRYQQRQARGQYEKQPRMKVRQSQLALEESTKHATDPEATDATGSGAQKKQAETFDERDDYEFVDVCRRVRGCVFVCM